MCQCVGVRENTILYTQYVVEVQHSVRAFGDFNNTLVPTNPLASDCKVLLSSPSSTPLIDLINDSVIVDSYCYVIVIVRVRVVDTKNRGVGRNGEERRREEWRVE